jgi:hypothetical protein
MNHNKKRLTEELRTVGGSWVRQPPINGSWLTPTGQLIKLTLGNTIEDLEEQTMEFLDRFPLYSHSYTNCSISFKGNPNN